MYTYVCVCKGGVYFNIVSQKSISLDFIPSPPTHDVSFYPHCTACYVCPVFIFHCIATYHWRAETNVMERTCTCWIWCCCVWHANVCQCQWCWSFWWLLLLLKGPQILARTPTHNSVNFVCLIKLGIFHWTSKTVDRFQIPACMALLRFLCKQSWPGVMACLSSWLFSLSLSLSFSLSLKSRRRSVVWTSLFLHVFSGLALITQTGPKNHNTFIANIISSFLQSKKPSFLYYVVFFFICNLCFVMHVYIVWLYYIMCMFFSCYGMLTFF